MQVVKIYNILLKQRKNVPRNYFQTLKMQRRIRLSAMQTAGQLERPQGLMYQTLHRVLMLQYLWITEKWNGMAKKPRQLLNGVLPLYEWLSLIHTRTTPMETAYLKVVSVTHLYMFTIHQDSNYINVCYSRRPMPKCTEHWKMPHGSIHPEGSNSPVY